ncbi:hypothetical protein ADEAN_000662800 [Angomonas deanei]|uniref:Uncharacterized protein n=1 Tax=Angomonas deanei TaxID=59799 RepID=A0A7G2CID9_9TRYP|nr:hypothetical protein ADEAN_000662800 [Angomonas deanei]
MTIQNKEVVQLVSSFSPGTSVRPSEKKSTSHLNTTAAFGSSTGSAGSDTRLHGELHRRVGDILEAKLEARRKELERLPSSSNDYTYPSPAADAEEHVNPSVGIRVQPLRSTAPAPHSAREPVSKRGAPSKHSRYVSSVRERVEKFREADEQEGSPLELVRVNRLVAVPDHDRTMMAGCSTAHTTPSGNYIVGGKVDDRVRSSEWYRLHGGEGDVRPGFMAMRSYADDFRLFFQWCANPYRPSPQEEEVKHGAGERHGNENEATAESSAPGGPAEGKPPSRRVSAAVSGDMANTLSDILGLVEEKYGKPLTQEERDAANKRLQELRAQRKSALEGMTGSEGQKEVHSPSAGSGAAAGSSAATGSGGVRQGELESGASGLAGSAAEGQLNAGESEQADHNANTMHGGVPTQGQGDLTKDTAQSGNAGRAEGGMEGGESEDAMNPSVPVVAVPGDKSAHGNTPSSGDGGTAAGDEGALSGMPGASQGKGGAESFPSGNTSPQSVAQEGSTAGTESGGKFTVPTFGESGEGHASDTNPIAPPPSGRHNLDHTVTEQEMEKMQSNNDYSEEGNTKSGGGNDVNGNNANDSFCE